MAFKIIILACALVAVNAGYLGAPAAIAPAVAYSAAPSVSHVSYSSPLVSYGGPSVAVASPALTSQSSNILRSFGNLGQVATQSKTISTPYSSVTKSDVRVSNPGIHTYAASPLAYAAPAAHLSYAAAPAAHLSYAAAPAAHLSYAAHPAAHLSYAAHAQPLVHAAPAPIVKSGLLGVAYSPATAVSHMTYSAPAIGLTYAY